jgi:hypothetical protein
MAVRFSDSRWVTSTAIDEEGNKPACAIRADHHSAARQLISEKLIAISDLVLWFFQSLDEVIRPRLCTSVVRRLLDVFVL